MEGRRKREENDQNSEKSKDTYIPYRIPEKYYYYKIKNIPYFFNKKNFAVLLEQFHVKEENVSIGYDFFGRQNGTAIVQVFGKTNSRYVVTKMTYYYYSKENIFEVEETNEEEFNNYKKNEEEFGKKGYNFYGEEKKTEEEKDLPPKDHKNIFLKLKNLKENTKEKDIQRIFKGYNLCLNGIKFSGKKRKREENEEGNFQAVIAFKTNEESQKALENEAEKIKNFTEAILEKSNLNEFEEMISENKPWTPWNEIIPNYLNVTLSSREVKTGLLLYNLPLDCKPDDIMTYLGNFITNISNIRVNRNCLFHYGTALAIFQNEKEAAEAKTFIDNHPLKSKDRIKKIKYMKLLDFINLNDKH